MDKLEYSKNMFRVFMEAFDTIPAIRDGKGDMNAITSFSQDLKMFRKFRRKYSFSESSSEAKDIIDKWNKYIQLRNDEDFIPFDMSKNRQLYNSLF